MPAPVMPSGGGYTPLPIPKSAEPALWQDRVLARIEGIPILTEHKLREMGTVRPDWSQWGTTGLHEVSGGFDDAVSAAHDLAASSQYEGVGGKPGNNSYQAQAVLQGPSGAYYVTGLGEYHYGPGMAPFSIDSREGTVAPQIVPAVPELQAIVGGRQFIDLRPQGS